MRLGASAALNGPEQSRLDRLKDLFTIDYPSPSDIVGSTNLEAQLEAFVQGDRDALSNLRFNDDFILIRRLGVAVPLKFGPQDELNGSAFFGVTNIRKNLIPDQLSFEGNLLLGRPVQFRNHTVTQGFLYFSQNFEFGSQRSTTNLNLQIEMRR